MKKPKNECSLLSISSIFSLSEGVFSGRTALGVRCCYNIMPHETADVKYIHDNFTAEMNFMSLTLDTGPPDERENWAGRDDQNQNRSAVPPKIPSAHLHRRNEPIQTGKALQLQPAANPNLRTYDFADELGAVVMTEAVYPPQPPPPSALCLLRPLAYSNDASREVRLSDDFAFRRTANPSGNRRVAIQQ